VAGAEGQYAPVVSQSATTDTGAPLSLDNWLASGSGYALAEATVRHDLRLIAGLRLDYATTGGLSPSPDAAAIWRPYARGITKFFFGRAFRAPSIYEIEYHDGGISQVPSADLGPETIYTWQLEHTHAFGGRLFATAGMFFNDVRGLINLGDAGDSAVACTNAEGCVQYRNLGHVGTLGAEAEIRRAWGVGGSFSLAYAFQHSRDLEAGPLFGRAATAIVNSPEHLVYLRAVRPVVRRLIVLGGELVYGSPRLRRDGQHTAHMALANLTVSGALASARLRYALSVYNLFDWRYGIPVGDEYLDAQQEVRQLGRSFLVSLSAGF
jgi:outer membrane receptor protein involved in Fe transport